MERQIHQLQKYSLGESYEESLVIVCIIKELHELKKKSVYIEYKKYKKTCLKEQFVFTSTFKKSIGLIYTVFSSKNCTMLRARGFLLKLRCLSPLGSVLLFALAKYYI